MSATARQPELFKCDKDWVIVDLPAGEKARWREQADGTIRLVAGGQSLTVTREGRGRAGKDRFCVSGIRNENGGAVQARGMAFLARTVGRILKWQKRTEQRLATLEEKVGISAAPAAMPGKNPGKASRGKLCSVPVKVEWPQSRYVPQNAAGGFARVPMKLVPVSSTFADGEYRLLQAILFLAQGTGLLWAGKWKLAELAKIDPADVKRFLHSLINRGYLRATGKTLRKGVREYELLTHPSLITPDEQVEFFGGEDRASTGGRSSRNGGKPSPQSDESTESDESQKDESRARTMVKKRQGTTPALASKTRAKCREDSEKRTRGKFAVSRNAYDDDRWRRLFDVLGAEEMHDNGARWAMRFGMEPDALNTILSDVDGRNGKAIENPAAFFESAWQATPAGARESKRRKQAKA